MKTILRLSILVLLIVLIGIGIVAFFENPTIQNWLGLEASAGRGGRVAEAGSGLFEGQGAETSWRGGGWGRGFGAGRGEGAGVGRGIGQGEGGGAGWGARRGEHLDEFPSSAGWLGLLGVLLRLVILMALVVALVKIGRWIGRKFKSNGGMPAQDASPS